MGSAPRGAGSRHRNAGPQTRAARTQQGPRPGGRRARQDNNVRDSAELGEELVTSLLLDVFERVEREGDGKGAVSERKLRISALAFNADNDGVTIREERLDESGRAADVHDSAATCGISSRRDEIGRHLIALVLVEAGARASARWRSSSSASLHRPSDPCIAARHRVLRARPVPAQRTHSATASRTRRHP